MSMSRACAKASRLDSAAMRGHRKIIGMSRYHRLPIASAIARREDYALHTRILLGDDAYTDEQKKLIPPAVWPIVDTHPGSGRKVLFVGVHARQIIEMSTAESRLLLSDLLEHATQR
jgi:hypothetical protein